MFFSRWNLCVVVFCKRLCSRSWIQANKRAVIKCCPQKTALGICGEVACREESSKQTGTHLPSSLSVCISLSGLSGLTDYKHSHLWLSKGSLYFLKEPKSSFLLSKVRFLFSSMFCIYYGDTQTFGPINFSTTKGFEHLGQRNSFKGVGNLMEFLFWKALPAFLCIFRELMQFPKSLWTLWAKKPS